MVKFDKYIRSTKFKTYRYAANQNHDSFDNQFGKHVAKPPPVYKPITDAEGIKRAYTEGDTHVHGKTLYVAGSQLRFQDWFDDFTKIPFWGDLRESARYKAAEAVLKANPQIENVVGHSLGGSVALELQKQFADRGLKSRTYGAPVWDPFGYQQLGDGPKAERYRNFFDPVSRFDGSATNYVKWNPVDNFSMTHTYQNIADMKVIENDYGK